MFSLLKNNSRSLEETLDDLICQHKQLEDEAKALFEEINMTPEQIDEALNNPEHFDAETLKLLENERSRQNRLFPSHQETTPPSSLLQRRRAMRQAAKWIAVR